MKYITQNTKQLQDAIFEILKEWDAENRGYWFGYGQLDEQLRNEHGLHTESLKLYKKALQSLKAEGKVMTTALFREDNGLLNGTGWFFNYFKLKNELVKQHFPGMPGVKTKENE